MFPRPPRGGPETKRLVVGRRDQQLMTNDMYIPPAINLIFVKKKRPRNQKTPRRSSRPIVDDE